MTDEKDKPLPVPQAIVAGTAAIVRTGRGEDGALAVFQALVPSLLERLPRFIGQRFASRAGAYLAARYKALTGKDPEDCPEEAQAEAREAIDSDAVVEHMQDLLRHVDDAVIPALARLGAQYRTAPLDGFFRGMSRMLCDMSAEDLEFLRRIVLALDYIPPRPAVFMLTSDVGDNSGIYCWFKLHRGEKVERHRLRDYEDRAMHIFHLMKSNGLGQDAPGGVWGSAIGPLSVVLVDETADRVKSIIDP